MKDMTIQKDPAMLAFEIRTLQSQAEAILTRYVIEIGRRLCEAKSVLPHGEWGSWLKEQVQFSQSTANNYMKIYERYGTDQQNLFGDAKSEAVGNLPYTKALKLLAVPDDEVEDFIAENNVEAMSTRELEKVIRERDEARAALNKERESTDVMAAKLDDAIEAARAQAAKEAKSAIAEAEDRAEEASREADALRAELDELKSRPVEVAVQEPDPAELENVRAEERSKYLEATAALEKKLAEAEAKAAKEAEKAKKLKDKVDKAGEEAKADALKEINIALSAQREAEAAKTDAEARAKALEEKLKTANGDAATFKVYFQSVQEDCNRMLGLIKKADDDQAAKFSTALRSLLDSVGGMLS